MLPQDAGTLAKSLLFDPFFINKIQIDFSFFFANILLPQTLTRSTLSLQPGNLIYYFHFFVQIRTENASGSFSAEAQPAIST